jgi:hypothetical protein
MENRSLERMKNKISKRITSGKKIRIEWDAGGDETPVNFIDKDGDFFEKEEAVSLISKLIEELNLPCAGEHYHKGEGEIYTTAENAVAIRFSGNEHTYSWDEKGLPDSQSGNVIAEDRGQLRRFLKRSTILLNLVYDWKGNWEITLNTRIEEGDAPLLTDEAKQYYEKILHPLAEPYLRHFGQKEDHFLGGTVGLAMEIGETDESVVEIFPEFKILTEHQNKEVILFP